MRTMLIAPLLVFSFALAGCASDAAPADSKASASASSSATMVPEGTLKSVPGAETKPGPSDANSLSGQYTSCLDDNGMVYPKDGKELTQAENSANEAAQAACKAILEKVTKP